MWLLIEVDDQKDAGKNEKRRFLLNSESVQITGLPLEATIEAQGCEVHPNTPETKRRDDD